MNEKLVAVAVAEDGNIAPHAGRASRWLVYVVSHESSASLAWTIDLTDIGSLHEWHVRGDGNRHPLHYVDVAIAGSAGDGVKRNLLERNTTLLTTLETSPLKAVAAYQIGELTEGLPHEEQHCLMRNSTASKPAIRRTLMGHTVKPSAWCSQCRRSTATVDSVGILFDEKYQTCRAGFRVGDRVSRWHRTYAGVCCSR